MKFPDGSKSIDSQFVVCALILLVHFEGCLKSYSNICPSEVPVNNVLVFNDILPTF